MLNVRREFTLSVFEGMFDVFPSLRPIPGPEELTYTVTKGLGGSGMFFRLYADECILVASLLVLSSPRRVCRRDLGLSA